jgi:hypothetical protein
MLRPTALCVLIGLSIAGPAAAAEAQSKAVEPTESGQGAQAPDDDGNVLDKTRRGLHDGTEYVVREVDSWFGKRPFEEGGRVAGRVALRALWRQDQGVDWLGRFGIRVNLPNLRDRGGFLFVGRDNEQEVVSDRPEAFKRNQLLIEETRDQQSFFAGLGAQLADAVALRAGFRGGLKPYAQARYEKLWHFGERSQLDFKETLFWTLNDGFGSTTSLVYDFAPRPDLTLRWQNAATWTENNVGVQWGTSIGAYWSLGSLRQFSVEGLVNGQSGLDIGVTEYGVRTRWEQPVYRDWLTAELIVGYFWPQASEFTPRTTAWALGAGVTMRF